MWKRGHHPLVVLYGVLLLFWAACDASPQSTQVRSTVRPSNQTASVPSAAPLTKVDWANFIYLSSCYENARPFHTKNGQANNGYIHFVVYPPKYGDLVGDEQPEAVVPYQCSAADSEGVHVFVYTGNTSHIRLIGDLPALPQDPRDTNYNGVLYGITGIAIRNKELHLEGYGYSATAAHCCPDLFIKTSYRWNGKTFVIIQSDVSKKR